MRVITLNSNDVESHAGRLAEMVGMTTNTFFDAIVGVRHGGSLVCDSFCMHFPKERYGIRTDISLQRPCTKYKNSRLRVLLKRLPIHMLNLMRITESVLLELKHRLVRPSRNGDIVVPEILSKVLKEKSQPEIVLIDDAIDSGVTLQTIVESLKRINPGVLVSIAVLTETTNSACIRADYSLYHNRTLIRFPWSNDFKTR